MQFPYETFETRFSGLHHKDERFSLRCIEPPTIEPVTVDNVKLHSHISHAVEDSLIAGWIRTGRELAENYQHRAYISQDWELAFDLPPRDVFNLFRPPLIAVASIAVYDIANVETILYQRDITQTPLPAPAIGAENFFIDDVSEPARIALAKTREWPKIDYRAINAVKIRFRAGYCGDGSNEQPTHYGSGTPENTFGDNDDYYVDTFANMIYGPKGGRNLAGRIGYKNNGTVGGKEAIVLYCSFRNENRAAEIDEAPKAFYDLLYSDRNHL